VSSAPNASRDALDFDPAVEVNVDSGRRRSGVMTTISRRSSEMVFAYIDK
jgi:hypothetical protein